MKWSRIWGSSSIFLCGNHCYAGMSSRAEKYQFLTSDLAPFKLLTSQRWWKNCDLAKVAFWKVQLTRPSYTLRLGPKMFCNFLGFYGGEHQRFEY
jgi:hypothetical protein